MYGNLTRGLITDIVCDGVSTFRYTLGFATDYTVEEPFNTKVLSDNFCEVRLLSEEVRK